MSTRNTRSIITKKSITNTEPITKKPKSKTKKTRKDNQFLLAYCHSKKHCNDNIKRELKNFNDNIIIDTNDAYDNIKGDYIIDLSINVYREDELLAVYQKKYDYIYLVNCPSNVYIKNKNLNPVIFRNMLKILKPDGILLTKFSDGAIQEVSTKEVHDFLYAEEHKEFTPEFLEETNKRILEDKKALIEIVRKGIEEYLRNQNIPLQLLSDTENENYVSPIYEDDIGAGYHEFFIFKKNY